MREIYLNICMIQYTSIHTNEYGGVPQEHSIAPKSCATAKATATVTTISNATKYTIWYQENENIHIKLERSYWPFIVEKRIALAIYSRLHGHFIFTAMKFISLCRQSFLALRLLSVEKFTTDKHKKHHTILMFKFCSVYN